MPKRHSDQLTGLTVGGGFVGRERELDRIGVLLRGPARLVTLIGSGGIGKTRLADEAARRLHRARGTPVWCVRLARLPADADASAVREAVIGAVLAEGFAGASGWNGAVQRLSPADAAGRVTPTLLIADNCEHLLPGAGTVIAELLDAVAGLTILATSRGPIGWIDEQLVVVPPLSATQSLELFTQRAALTGRPISGPDQLRLARRICRRMHGNPLFIRLAAARMFYEPLSMIHEQLGGEPNDARMRWRRRPQVGDDDRHRSITDVIAWSYQLCDDKQQLLFDRLSVFAPGYDINPEDADAGTADVGADIAAIEVICADDMAIDGAPSATGAVDAGLVIGLARAEIRELLDRLVDQSLVSIHRSANTARYFLLESLRLFAAERLAERTTADVDEPTRLARRHCHYYRNTLRHVQAEWFGPAEQQLLIWAAGAWSNIRRAIDFSLAAGEPEIGLQICVGMLSLRAPFFLGSLPEIRSRLEQTLATTQASQSKSTELQIDAMAMMAWLAVLPGRLGEAEELLERCVATCGGSATHAEHWRDRPDVDIGLPAMVDFACAELMLASRDPRAITVFARAREKFRAVGDRGGEAMSAMFEALAAAYYGSAEQALTINRHHLQRTTAAGAGWSRWWAQLTLAIALTEHGDPQEASQLARAALANQLPMGDSWGAAWAAHVHMWALARVLRERKTAASTRRDTMVKRATEIAYLAGGLKRQRAGLGVVELAGPFADATHAAEQIAREVLGDDAYSNAENRGSRPSAEHSEPQRLALGELSITPLPADDSDDKGTSPTWQTLSKTEREVAVLAAAGWPNSAIAERRGTSSRTVDAQISSILEKLSITSRREIFGFVPDNQRDRVSAERHR